MATQAQTEAAQSHPYTRAGYVAPYRIIGFSGPLDGDSGQFLNRAFGGDGLSFEPQYGGSCDVCGASIIDMTHVVDARGKRFKVGCDCAEYADASGDMIAEIRAAQREAARARRISRAKPERDALIAAQKARGESRLVELYDAYNALDWELLAGIAHEDDEQALKGATAADQAREYKRRATDGSNVQTATWIAERAIEDFAAGERGASIPQPNPALSSHHPSDGRVELELRIFSILRGYNDAGAWQLTRMVDRVGRIYTTFGKIPATYVEDPTDKYGGDVVSALNAQEFKAVKATIKNKKTDKFLNCAVTEITRIAVPKAKKAKKAA